MSKYEYIPDEKMPGEDIADEILWVLEKEFRQEFPDKSFNRNIEDSIGMLSARATEEYRANPVPASVWLERDGWLRK